MAARLSVLPSRSVGCVGSSFSGRRIVLQGRGGGQLNICGVPAWERRRKRRGTCAYNRSNSEADFKLPGDTLYELLGIPTEVGLNEIKTAYREKARRYHPDANPPSKKDECTKKFLQVQEAYEVLADPDLRADYDFRLRQPLSMQAMTTWFSSKGKSRNRRSSQSVVHADEVNKEAWRAQWAAQVDGLKRDFGRKNPGSWAARVQQMHQEAEKEVEKDMSDS